MLNGCFGLKTFDLSYCKADGNIKLSYSTCIDTKENIKSKCSDTFNYNSEVSTKSEIKNKLYNNIQFSSNVDCYNYPALMVHDKFEYIEHINNKSLLISKINDTAYFDIKIVTNPNGFTHEKLGFMKFGLGRAKSTSTKINSKIKCFDVNNYSAEVLIKPKIKAKLFNNTQFNTNTDCYNYPLSNIYDKVEYIGYINSNHSLIFRVDNTVYFNIKIVTNTDEPIYRKFGFMKFGLGKPSDRLKGYINYTTNIDNSSFPSLNINDKPKVFNSYLDRFVFPSLCIYDKSKVFDFYVDKFASPSLYIYENNLFNSYIYKFAFPSLYIYENSLFNSYIDRFVFPSLCIYDKSKVFDSYVDKFAFPSLRIYDRLTLYNLTIDKYVELVILINQVVHLDVTLNKGDILVLDSNNFNLTINDQNMLHLHRGDWITLDRNLVDFKIQSEIGDKIEGKLIYNERFF